MFNLNFYGFLFVHFLSLLLNIYIFMDKSDNQLHSRDLFIVHFICYFLCMMRIINVEIGKAYSTEYNLLNIWPYFYFYHICIQIIFDVLFILSKQINKNDNYKGVWVVPFFLVNKVYFHNRAPWETPLHDKIFYFLNALIH